MDMDIKDRELLNQLQRERMIKDDSLYNYIYAVDKYTKLFDMSMVDLLAEAEDEEEQGIRWKRRKLKRRLTEFRSHVYNEFSKRTADKFFVFIKIVYRHFDIELHDLPSISAKAGNISRPITFDDLPDYDIIKHALTLVPVKYQALILFMCSSGSAQKECLNLTIQDYIDATKEYHNANNIYDCIKELNSQLDEGIMIVPTFRCMVREKTNKFYYTFCDPYTVKIINEYLSSESRKLTSDSSLFNMNPQYLMKKFRYLSDEELKLSRVNGWSRFRCHMLRKFHASRLKNKVGMDIVDELQGRGKSSTRESYFLENPDELKELYMKHMNVVSFDVELKNNTLLKENSKLRESINENKIMQHNIMKRLDKLENSDFVDNDRITELLQR